MTPAQTEQYSAALARITGTGIEVVGTGTAKDGRKVWCVPSQRDRNRWHVVTLSTDGRTLSCDCQAGQHGRYCCHRAAVRARIEEETPSSTMQLMAEAEATLARINASLSRPRVPAPDTRKFSIRK
jgi:hypothetical protein